MNDDQEGGRQDAFQADGEKYTPPGMAGDVFIQRQANQRQAGSDYAVGHGLPRQL